MYSAQADKVGNGAAIAAPLSRNKIRIYEGLV